MTTKNENALLDLVAEKIGARNDAQLARGLEVAPPVISKIRHNRLPVGTSMVVKIHETTGMTVRDIKSYITHGPQQVVKEDRTYIPTWLVRECGSVSLVALYEADLAHLKSHGFVKVGETTYYAKGAK